MGLTARGPAPRSRAEAQTAFEAAVIATLWEGFSRANSAHARKFERVLNGPRRWFLFAEEIFPNRGEVTVQNLNRETVRVPVLLGSGLRKPLRKEGWLISNRYPEVRERQLRWLREGRKFTLDELVSGVLKNPESPYMPYSYPIEGSFFEGGSALMIQSSGLVVEISPQAGLVYQSVRSRSVGLLLTESLEAAGAYEALNPRDLTMTKR